MAMKQKVFTGCVNDSVGCIYDSNVLLKCLSSFWLKYNLFKSAGCKIGLFCLPVPYLF